jgi:hypothetical protein
MALAERWQLGRNKGQNRRRTPGGDICKFTG